MASAKNVFRVKELISMGILELFFSIFKSPDALNTAAWSVDQDLQVPRLSFYCCSVQGEKSLNLVSRVLSRTLPEGTGV